jgi:hypothetical protein
MLNMLYDIDQVAIGAAPRLSSLPRDLATGNARSNPLPVRPAVLRFTADFAGLLEIPRAEFAGPEGGEHVGLDPAAAGVVALDGNFDIAPRAAILELAHLTAGWQ